MSTTNSSDRIILVCPSGGTVEASAKVKSYSSSSHMQRIAALRMKKSGLSVQRIKSGNGVAG